MADNGKTAKPKGTVKDREFFATIGRKGGMQTKRRKLQENPNYYSEIGVKGGESMKRTHGKEFYSQIGRMGKKNQDTDAEQNQDQHQDSQEAA